MPHMMGMNEEKGMEGMPGKEGMMGGYEEDGYEGTPLSYISGTLDELIQKGGASREDLMMLKGRVDEVKADVDGEDESPGDGYNDSTDRAEPNRRPGNLMVALGFKDKHK